MATSVGEIALDLILNSDEFESRVSEIAKKTADSTKQNSGFADSLNKVGSTSTAVGKTLLGISAPITGIGIASTKSALTFEDSMAKVMTIADKTEMSYDDMKSAIMDLSSQTGISANEIADNVYNAISAGQKTGDAVNFVSNSTKLAKAGFADAGSALDILTTILNAYGMEASEVTNVSDMLIQTQNKGKVTVGELSTAMGKVIPTANANNVALDQLCSGYAIMTANGVACAESTTYMNSMLNELGKSGTGVAKILKAKTGMSFSECMASGMSLGDVLAILDESAKADGLAFTDLWGSSEAAKAGLILLGDEGKEFNSMLGDMQNSTGATDEAFKTLDTTSYKMQKAINEVKNAGIQLGGILLQTLAPVIVTVCNAVSKACEWFNSLDDSTKKIIFIVSGLVTALGGVLFTFGKVATGLSSLITTMKTAGTIFSGLSGSAGILKGGFAMLNPTVLAVVAVIGVLVGAIIYLWNTNEEFRNAIISIWETIKTTFSNFTNGIVERLNKLGFDFKNFGEVVKATWDSFCKVLAPVFEGAFASIANTFVYVTNTILSLFDIFAGIFSGDWVQCWTGIKNLFTGWGDFLIGKFSTIFTTSKNITNVFLGWFGTSWSNLWNSVKTFFVNIWTSIKNFFTSTLNSIRSFLTTVLNNIKSTFTTVWNSIKSFITTVLNGIKSVVMSVWNSIKSFITSVVNTIKSIITSVWNGIKSTTSSVFNGIKSTITSIWSSIKSGVSSAVNSVKSTIVSGLENAWSYIKSIPSKAYTWGKDMIQGLIDGIKSMIGKVGDAAKGVADKVSSFLHFSCPDEGPLSTYESWMPDFMEGLAKGIKGNRNVVANAISDLTSMMKTDFQTPELSSSMKFGLETPELRNTARSSNIQTATENSEMFNKLSEMFNTVMNNNSAGDIIIPVYVGGNVIDEVVVKAQDRRKLRSGGMA